MYVYIYMYIHVCIYIYAYIYIYVCIYIYISLSLYIYIERDTHIHSRGGCNRGHLFETCMKACDSLCDWQLLSGGIFLLTDACPVLL